MSVTTTANTVCDHCAASYIAVDGGYHPKNWLHVTLEIFSNDGKYSQSMRTRSSCDFCPTCVRVYGHVKLKIITSERSNNE